MTRYHRLPLLRSQQQLLVDLADAASRVQPDNPSFRTIATATSDRLIVMHPGIQPDYEGAFLSDIRVLASERFVDIESQDGSDLQFNLTPRGVVLADDARAILNESSGASGSVADEVRKNLRTVILGADAGVDQKDEPREWGSRWIAVDETPFRARGQGRIWRVWDQGEASRKPWQRTQYALKELRYDNVSVSSTKYRRLVREIEQTAKFEHPNIIRVVDFLTPSEDDADRTPYFVMPMAESSLERAKDLAGNLESALRIGIALADALATAHDAGVVHRDVKPENVLLSGDARTAVLTDFGICFLIDADRLTGNDAETVGSRDFAAPELLGGGQIENVGPRSDIYSLGKTLYSVVNGGEVFPRERHRSPRWYLPHTREDARLEHLHGLLDRMAVEDPEKRFATMRECKAHLERALTNVVRGAHFTSGMYGGSDSSVERALRFDGALRQSAGVARSDAIHLEVEGAISAARARAGDELAKVGSIDREAMSQRIIVAADELLSVGIPLLVHGEAAAFADWVHATTEPNRRKGPEHHQSLSRSILRAAAVLALHAAGASAWRRGRFDALRLVVDGQLANSNFVHLNHLADNSTSLFPWIVDTVPGLGVVRQLEPQVSTAPAPVIALVAGIAAMVELRRLPADQFTRAQHDEASRPPIAYPAFGNTQISWVSEIGRSFHSRPSIENAVARSLFDMTVEEFREFARASVPILARAFAGASERMIAWEFDIDRSGDWRRWLQ